MAVLVIAEVKGQTQQGYEGMRGLLNETLKESPGFILHTAHAIEHGWRIIELWQSKEDSDRFYAENVAPNLPPGIHPKRTVQELYDVLTA
jgi:hypothetical protein